MDIKSLFKKISEILSGKNYGIQDNPSVVTFTGGMGAQVISAAIYFMLDRSKVPVYADLSYFNSCEKVALAGNKGEVSHWGWQLDMFELNMNLFKVNPDLNNKNSNYIVDGIDKSRLGLQALSSPDIRSHFNLRDHYYHDFELNTDYICVHIRRGDYVNVASHIISEKEFLKITKKFSSICGRVIIVSDSIIGKDFRSEIRKKFERAEFYDDISAEKAHIIMRKAKILICSNSQFSLIAAILNTTGLVLIPRRWFGGEDRMLEEPLHDYCDFQLFDNN